MEERQNRSHEGSSTRRIASEVRLRNDIGYAESPRLGSDGFGDEGAADWEKSHGSAPRVGLLISWDESSAILGISLF